MKKILVIFTGGTIGSLKTDQSINVDPATTYELIQLYKECPSNRQVQFEIEQPLNVLSENLVPEDWMTIIHKLNTVDYNQYQGIIMTHGTDTLPFTSAALSYVFSHIPIPLVLIASNFPLNDSRSKGLNNFSHAVDFIVEHSPPGVFVIFENKLDEALVHLGTRLTPSDPFTDEFDSTYSTAFGSMKMRGLTHNNHSLNPTLEMVRQIRPPAFEKSQISFSSEILYIKPHLGLDYRYYDFSHYKPKAVFHELYHSGTACTRSVDYIRSSLLDFIVYCKSNDVEVYIAPLKSDDFYASSLQLLEAGAVPLKHISIEAALVKLMLAYGTFADHEEVRAFMNDTSLYFEVHLEISTG